MYSKFPRNPGTRKGRISGKAYGSCWAIVNLIMRQRHIRIIRSGSGVGDIQESDCAWACNGNITGLQTTIPCYTDRRLGHKTYSKAVKSIDERTSNRWKFSLYTNRAPIYGHNLTINKGGE